MGRERIELGARGEEIAREYLRARGYTISALNVRTRSGEIDIVAKKGGVIVFVEVKTRRGSSLGPPFISVTPLKKMHLIRSAWSYLARRGLTSNAWRIDIISVMLDNGSMQAGIDVIENAVEHDYI